MVAVVLLVLVALLGGIDYYLAHSVWRLVKHFAPRASIAVPLTGFIVMTVLMAFCFFKPFGGALQRCASVIGAVWMGVFVYLLLFFLTADLITLIVRLCKVLTDSGMATLRLTAGITAVAATLAVCVYGICNARCIRTVEYDVSLSDTPSLELTVALISDVHLGAVGSESRLENIVAEINKLSPDLVCIAGDLFDTDYNSITDPERAVKLLKQINATHGVYACLGNHDAGKTLPDMEDFLQRADIRLLKEDYVVIDNAFILAGRLDSSPIGGTGGIWRGTIQDVLKGADPALPVVVLDHNPMNADGYRNEVGLILSGHTHRGQIFPGSLITDAMYTVDYGYYRYPHGTQVIVSCGIGTWGLPMRVGTSCELVKINLSV